MNGAKRAWLLVFLSVGGGCSLPEGPLALTTHNPTAVVRLASPESARPVDREPVPETPQPAPGFDNSILLSPSVVRSTSQPVEENAPDVLGEVPPGFVDDVRLSQAVDDRVEPARAAPGEEKEDQEDTNLSRPRAERRGGGGGPTRSSEDEDNENEEDDFKSDLLVKALGLENSPVGLFGWLQGSFTGNPARPRDGQNFGVNPNSSANAFLFQQFYFVVEKLVEQEDEFDWGFRFDNLFGTDWQEFHSVGLFDNAFPVDGFGFDPVQFYGEVHLPVLTPGGVDIKGGRFFALPGYEAGQAPARPLNSTGYMFAYAQPFTYFGVMSTWHVTDRLNLYNGAVNGWDRWINEHYKWGYSGGASWDSKDDKTNLTFTFDWGPNQFPRFFPANYALPPNGSPTPPFMAGQRNPGYGSNNRTLFTTILVHEWTDALTMIMETDQGFERNIPNLGPHGTSRSAAWYGLGGWLLYELSDQLTGVYRAEVFRDVHGSRTGFDDTFYEMTLGLIYKPKTWFWVRPETRFDWAQGAPPYNAERSRTQLTLGFDMIFLF